MKIGLLVVATGKYISFVKQLRDSVEKYFLKGSPHQTTIFVFTDSPTVPERTVRLYKRHKKFPYPTLTRYHTFTRYHHELSEMDYLFYCDVDMRFVAPVGKEILGELVATAHPGFYQSDRRAYPYEDRQSSKAYIPSSEGKTYYCGGFNGGHSKTFLKMAKVISENISYDLRKHIIARWHDESHLNRYLIDYPPTVILPSSYCYPEESQLPFRPKLMALSKNHNELRYSGLEASFYQMKAAVISKILMPIKTRVDILLQFLSSQIIRKIAAFSYLIEFNDTYHINCDNHSQCKVDIDIVTVAFNNDKIIEVQAKLLQKNLADNYFYTVADQSTNPEMQNKIAGFCHRKKIAYIRLPQVKFFKANPSLSHGLALNWIYRRYIKPRNARYFGFLDHDIFPIKTTSLVRHLKNAVVYGLPQLRGDKWYLWGGFSFFNKSKLPTLDLDFLPWRALDTGGANWKIIYSLMDINKLEKLPHKYVELGRPETNNISDQKVSELLQSDRLLESIGDWLHVFNASGWRGTDAGNEKIKYLTKNIYKI